MRRIPEPRFFEGQAVQGAFGVGQIAKVSWHAIEERFHYYVECAGRMIQMQPEAMYPAQKLKWVA